MGSQQQFCLKWNNHSSNMLNVFEGLLTSESLVDVTLACDGLSLKAHKMVLSACSPFFQSLFQENPCKHPIVILKDIRFPDLKAIIDFMYKGEVNVGQAHLSALLKTAETLKVKGLAEVSGEDGQSSTGSVVQQEVPVFPQAQHSSDVANIVQTIDSSIRPSSDSPTGRKRKRTKWKNRGQSGGNDSETDDQGPAAKNPEIVSADVIEDDSSSIGVVDGPSDTRNAKESRIIIEEATIVGDYVEPAALMEQNMTTDSVQPTSSQLMLTNATSKDNDVNVPESRSYDSTVATLHPETVDLIDRPEDVKPTALVSYEEPPISPNATSSHHSQDDSNSMTMYMDPNSMPAIAGPSNYQQDKQPSASAGQVVILGRNPKGQALIFFNGFLYRYCFSKWLCSHNHYPACPGILLTTRGFSNPVLRIEHSHPPLTNFMSILEEIPGLSNSPETLTSIALSANWTHSSDVPNTPVIDERTTESVSYWNSEQQEEYETAVEPQVPVNVIPPKRCGRPRKNMLRPILNNSQTVKRKPGRPPKIKKVYRDKVSQFATQQDPDYELPRNLRDVNGVDTVKSKIELNKDEQERKTHGHTSEPDNETASTSYGPVTLPATCSTSYEPKPKRVIRIKKPFSVDYAVKKKVGKTGRPPKKRPGRPRKTPLPGHEVSKHSSTLKREVSQDPTAPNPHSVVSLTVPTQPPKDPLAKTARPVATVSSPKRLTSSFVPRVVPMKPPRPNILLKAVRPAVSHQVEVLPPRSRGMDKPTEFRNWLFHHEGDSSVVPPSHNANCRICGRFFSDRGLQRHMETHRDKDERVRFQCLFCEKTYFRKDHLKRHCLTSHPQLAITQD